MTTVLHSLRLVDDGIVTDDAWVAFADGVVLARGTGASWREMPVAETVDGGGAQRVAGEGGQAGSRRALAAAAAGTRAASRARRAALPGRMRAQRQTWPRGLPRRTPSWNNRGSDPPARR